MPGNAAPPSDEVISQTLRDVVKHRFATNDHNRLTLKLVRNAAQEELGLPDDFFKEDERWKKSSKQIVNDCVAQLEAEAEEHKAEASAGNSQTSPAKEQDREHETSTAPRASPQRAAKRKPPAKSPAKPRKRAKKTVEVGSDQEDSNRSDDDDVSHGKVNSQPAQNSKETSSPQPKPDTDSQLSSPIDEPPRPKIKRKKNIDPSSDKKPAKTKPSTKKAGASSNATPQQDEIKKLQSWLSKCGIRRLWGKELKKFDSDKEKIKHLKGLLTDVGMTGRFSEEKARQIKEEREFKADLEAIQEGNKHWGQGAEEDEEDSDRPKRKRTARGLPQLPDFGDEED